MPNRNSVSRRWLGALGLGLTVTLALALASQASPISAPRRVFHDMQAQAQGGLSARWDARTNIPTFLRGPVPYVFSAAEKAAPVTGALNFLSRYRTLFRMTDPAQELTLMQTAHDTVGQTHMRFKQMYQGVAVYNRSLYVHVDAEGQVLGVSGHYEPGLALSVQPAVRVETAEGLALQAAGSAGDTRLVGTTQLVVYVADTGAATLTWKVEVETRRPFGRDYYFIQARGGEVVKVLPAIAYEKNRTVYDAHDTENADQISQEGEVPDDPSGAAVYANAGKTYDYYLKTFNRDSYDDAGGKIDLVIHAPEADNAFWSGDSLWFGEGDGDTFSKPLTSLDTVAHEFTHAVTQYTANLAYENQSGALNESFSDVFGVMVDRANWHLGEGIVNCSAFPAGHCWLRDMQDPTLGGDFPNGDWGQPAVMADYVELPNDRKHDNGGVHVNSGIPNHTFYLAVMASSKEGMEQVWYRALTNYLTETSDFAEYADALKASAADLYGASSPEAKAVETAIEGTGLLSGAPAAPEPTATPTRRGKSMPTPTPAAGGGCTELVANGSFEAKKSDPWVEQTASDLQIITADYPHTGQNGAWLGGSDEEAHQYLYQEIKIPNTARAVTLTYWYQLHEELLKTKAKPAEFSVLLTDADDQPLEELEKFASTDADDTWKQSTLDLSKYAGKTVRLAFSAAMARNNVSSFFVDDVSLVGCSKGGGGSQPSNTKGVEVQGQVTDANSGKAIEGATVYVLAPGKTVKEVWADGKVSRGEYLTSAVSDKKGNYITPDLLPRSQNYGVIILAKGYKAAGGDNVLKLNAATASPYALNAKLDKGF